MPPPPPGYVCKICKTPGHWIQACPGFKTKHEPRLPPLAPAAPEKEVWHAVEVPYADGEFTSFLIGKGGGLIQELVKWSGCRFINVQSTHEAKPGAAVRRVDICGGPEQVERAETAIRERIREFQSRKRVQADGSSERPQSHVPEAASDEESCVICLSSKRTHVLLPCGHRCLCAVCAANFEVGAEWQRVGGPPECPLCCRPVKDVHRVWD